MSERTVSRLAKGMPTQDGAGVSLSRIIGSPYLQRVDPFLMLDEFKSDDPNDYIAGFPSHPHRGFETVTYLIEGSVRHRDHMGSEGYLGPGSIQWMTAGRGIIHEEMPQQENGMLWGFQLWVNLPAKDKMTDPRYQDIPAEDVPETDFDAGVVRVLAGELNGKVGPVSGVATQPRFFDIRWEEDGVFRNSLPENHTAFVYAYKGDITVGKQVIRAGEVAILSAGEAVALEAKGGSGCLLVGGQPLNEPVVQYGPFVMNTVEEIEQAIQDFQSGRLTA
ncbi:pirin family protein [Natronospirillum operosum]|uniref:Pirin family protein n=1 Tax=Natronospirillum operosum TaxID=2759953 RepID=A0A4Z0WDN3_9GAMM|nr:pirin family protein [Natronospirillum operosum]TGG92038.1 pirin family protein [Natronospirillum operosum]